MSLPDRTQPPTPHSPAAAAAAYTVLPFVLLLALVVWIYPVLKHHHGLHPEPPVATATATSEAPNP
ncbi:hypothetical protein ABT093_39675 [Kitasatospora sp. NPDC002551]|uniref:hypothetical protein n=1 Tax=unclassified Kitasatospora TaxID=2633591 RepID=UPI0033315B81